MIVNIRKPVPKEENGIIEYKEPLISINCTLGEYNLIISALDLLSSERPEMKKILEEMSVTLITD